MANNNKTRHSNRLNADCSQLPSEHKSNIDIACKIMGWKVGYEMKICSCCSGQKWEQMPEYMIPPCGHPDVLVTMIFNLDGPDEIYVSQWRPSHNINDAIKVFDKIASTPLMISLDHDGFTPHCDRKYVCRIWDQSRRLMGFKMIAPSAETVCGAICAAAIKLIEWREKKNV